eukprot:235823-Rhodomonas_salina.1
MVNSPGFVIGRDIAPVSSPPGPRFSALVSGGFNLRLGSATNNPAAPPGPDDRLRSQIGGWTVCLRDHWRDGDESSGRRRVATWICCRKGHEGDRKTRVEYTLQPNTQLRCRVDRI